MKIRMNVIAEPLPEESGFPGVPVRPVFFTGNSKSAVAFIKVLDSDGKQTDEVLLQVNAKGRLSIARRREDL